MLLNDHWGLEWCIWVYVWFWWWVLWVNEAACAAWIFGIWFGVGDWVAWVDDIGCFRGALLRVRQWANSRHSRWLVFGRWCRVEWRHIVRACTWVLILSWSSTLPRLRCDWVWWVVVWCDLPFRLRWTWWHWLLEGRYRIVFLRTGRVLLLFWRRWLVLRWRDLDRMRWVGVDLIVFVEDRLRWL